MTAVRGAAATAELAALTYEEMANVADEGGHRSRSPQEYRDLAAWARRRTDAEQRLALETWARAAAIESAAP